MVSLALPTSQGCVEVSAGNSTQGCQVRKKGNVSRIDFKNFLKEIFKKDVFIFHVSECLPMYMCVHHVYVWGLRDQKRPGSEVMHTFSPSAWEREAGGSLT